MNSTAKGVLAFGVLAAGVALGALAEKAVARRLLPERELHEEHAARVGVETTSLNVLTDDGTSLYVEIDEGPGGDVPTVIFTHGYALSMASWPDQRAAMASVARCVLWDQRGHGRSTKGPPGATIDRLGLDLGCVLDAVAPDGDVVLVGHSMGGMTIMALASDRPELFRERVRGVALLATSAGGIADIDLGLPYPVARLAHRVAPAIGMALGPDRPVSALVERARRSTSDLGMLLTRAYSFGARPPAQGTRLVTDLINGTPIDVLADFLPALQVHDKIQALHVLADVDLLVMVGDSDLLTPPGHSAEIVRNLPRAQFVILPGVGHMIELEAADEVNQHLLELVERVGAPRA